MGALEIVRLERPHLSRYLRDFRHSDGCPLRWTPIGVTLQIVFDGAVLLPESFRGGCSFGAGLQNKPDLSRVISFKRFFKNLHPPKEWNAVGTGMGTLILTVPTLIRCTCLMNYAFSKVRCRAKTSADEARSAVLPVQTTRPSSSIA
jgi:hypothetical protein